MTPEFDERVIFLILWGLGCVVVYSRVLFLNVRTWRVRRDHRALRELLASIGLWLTSFASASAVASVLFAPVSSIRGFWTALALGAFLGVGIILATERTKSES